MAPSKKKPADNAVTTTKTSGGGVHKARSNKSASNQKNMERDALKAKLENLRERNDVKDVEEIGRLQAQYDEMEVDPTDDESSGAKDAGHDAPGLPTPGTSPSPAHDADAPVNSIEPRGPITGHDKEPTSGEGIDPGTAQEQEKVAFQKANTDPMLGIPFVDDAPTKSKLKSITIGIRRGLYLNEYPCAKNPLQIIRRLQSTPAQEDIASIPHIPLSGKADEKSLKEWKAAIKYGVAWPSESLTIADLSNDLRPLERLVLGKAGKKKPKPTIIIVKWPNDDKASYELKTDCLKFFRKDQKLLNKFVYKMAHFYQTEWDKAMGYDKIKKDLIPDHKIDFVRGFTPLRESKKHEPKNLAAKAKHRSSDDDDIDNDSSVDDDWSGHAEQSNDSREQGRMIHFASVIEMIEKRVPAEHRFAAIKDLAVEG